MTGPRAKNVSFVSPRFYLHTVGGAEVQMYMIAARLAETGLYRVSYVTPDIEESETEGCLQIVKIPRMKDQRDCTFEDFSRTLNSLSPALIFQVGRKEFTYFAARYCSTYKIPFLFRATSDIECRRFRQLPRFFSEFPLRKAVNIKRMKREAGMDRRTFWGMKMAATIVAQTKTQQELLRRLFEKTGKKIVLLENPHEVPPETSIIKDKEPIVLWLASVKSVKRPRLFLEICKQLRGQGCRMIMAGRMNEERFRGDIEKGVESGDLEYIENIGFEESNALIARARVFVLTSRREGMPNTLIQAWLRRTPTVSVGVDPDSMIAENDLGVHVKSVGEAVQAILKLVTDQEECERKATKAREYAIAKFGMDSQLGKFRDIVDAALDGN